MDSSELTRISKLENIENWSIWKFQISVLLKVNDAWDILQAEYNAARAPEASATEAVKQQYDRDVVAWKKADGKAQKIMVTTIPEHALVHIMNCTTTRGMWLKLGSVYEQKSLVNVRVLQQKWYIRCRKVLLTI